MSAVKKVLFGSTKVPNVEVKQSAPQLDEPVKQVESPELGGTSSEYQKRKRGKSSLKINTTSSSSSRGVGLNI